VSKQREKWLRGQYGMHFDREGRIPRTSPANINPVWRETDASSSVKRAGTREEELKTEPLLLLLFVSLSSFFGV